MISVLQRDFESLHPNSPSSYVNSRIQITDILSRTWCFLVYASRKLCRVIWHLITLQAHLPTFSLFC